MNIIIDLQEGFLDYQYTWGGNPDILFINIRDYHQSIKNKEVGYGHIREIHEIGRDLFNNCKVFWINNETFKPFKYYEEADLIRVIQREYGYLSSDFKLKKFKPEEGCWIGDGTAAAQEIPIPDDFIQVDSLAVNEYINRNGGRPYMLKLLNEKK